jgi:ribosome-binding protein aMBF1 (putative translation factor)
MAVIDRWTSGRESPKRVEISRIGRLASMGRLIRKPPDDFPKYQEALAANVKRLREKAGLSQQQLATMTELRQAMVSDIERCQAHVNPTLETLTRLADALEVDVLVLLRFRKT